MGFAGINHTAILVAALASFIFGAVYYGALGKPWMAAQGKSEADIENSGRPLPMLLVLSFVSALVMAWVLAGIIGHLGPGRVNVRNGIVSALFAWVGFVATTMTVNHGYQGARWSLTAIDGGHWLGVLLLQGAIIGWFGIHG